MTVSFIMHEAERKRLYLVYKKNVRFIQVHHIQKIE